MAKLYAFNEKERDDYLGGRKDQRAGKRQARPRKKWHRKGRSSSGGSASVTGTYGLIIESIPAAEYIGKPDDPETPDNMSSSLPGKTEDAVVIQDLVIDPTTGILKFQTATNDDGPILAWGVNYSKTPIALVEHQADESDNTTQSGLILQGTLATLRQEVEGFGTVEMRCFICAPPENRAIDTFTKGDAPVLGAVDTAMQIVYHSGGDEFFKLGSSACQEDED